MNLEQLKNICDKHDKIFVTGAGRSGTTIISRIISDMCGHEHIDSSIGIRATQTFEVLKKRVGEKGKMVFHGPEYYIYISQPTFPKDLFVVWVNRDWADIMNSAKRVGWNPTPYEKELRHYIKDSDLKLFDSMVFPENAYFYWKEYLKPNFRNYIEVNYTDFEEHQLFLPKNERKGFSIRQWQKNEHMVKWWTNEYNHYGERYVANWIGGEDCWWDRLEEVTNNWFSYFVKVFDELNIKPKSILEIGCGLGRFTRKFKDHYKVDTHGCDIVPDAIRECKLHQPDINYFVYNHKIPKVDLVLFVTTLAYVWDDAEYNRIKENIKDCKYIVLMEPFITGKIELPRIRLTMEKLRKDFPTHVFHEFNPDVISAGDDYKFVVGIKC